MPLDTIKLNGRDIDLHTAVTNPSFAARPVLASDPWEYVQLFLRRNKHEEAMFYWDQAAQFYKASAGLPETASPLTSYYCLLNCTKALLRVHKRTFRDLHGVAGRTEKGRKTLKNEVICFKQQGVLPELCGLMGDEVKGGAEVCLYDVFHHLPFIHRAFRLTYKSAPELFLPLDSMTFVKKPKSKEAWIAVAISPKHVNSKTEEMLPSGWERDVVQPGFVVRTKRRFTWDARDRDKSLASLARYHRKARACLVPIHASRNLWYMKKEGELSSRISHSSVPLIFAAMHRLSELARYEPLALARHLEQQHNWLLSEFLRIAPAQFIRAVASEITGLEFVTPYAMRM